MKTPALVIALSVSLLANLAGAFYLLKPPAASTRPRTENDLGPVLKPYAEIGSFLAENNSIPSLGWTPEQLAAFQIGIEASYKGKRLALSKDGTALKESINQRLQALAPPAADPVEEYFKTLREKESVQKTASNLHYRITQQGFGKLPGPSATVVVTFTARLPSGEALPALSRVRVRTSIKDLLPGMGEGLQLLKSGGKALLYLPPSLSFADKAWPQEVPKGAPLIFFVELHEVSK